MYTEQDQIKFLERIAVALETLAKIYEAETPSQFKPEAPKTHKRTAAIEVLEPIKETKA